MRARVRALQTFLFLRGGQLRSMCVSRKVEKSKVTVSSAFPTHKIDYTLSVCAEQRHCHRTIGLLFCEKERKRERETLCFRTIHFSHDTMMITLNPLALSIFSYCLAGLYIEFTSAFQIARSAVITTATHRLQNNGVHLNAGNAPFFADVIKEENSDCRGNKHKTVVVFGSSGYIGRAVVQESVQRGYNTIAIVRSAEKILSEEGQRLYQNSFDGAQVVELDVSNPQSLSQYLSGVQNVDTIVSCMASPIGTKKEAYAIDHQATLNCLNAGRDERVKARHFVLLSAFCCKNPLLQLQRAKLKFESELQNQSDMSYSIVRPTAFFKSVSGQLEGIQNGNPYVLFDDGAVTRCNPIAESELAEYMLNTLDDKEKWNKIMNVGGPDQPLTNKMLGDVSLNFGIRLYNFHTFELMHEGNDFAQYIIFFANSIFKTTALQMMHKAAGLKPKYVYAPTWVFDSIINTFHVLATLTKNQFLEDAAEYARIGKYYAVVDMLTTDPSEKYGKITMQDHYDKIANQGQDPFTPM